MTRNTGWQVGRYVGEAFKGICTVLEIRRYFEGRCVEGHGTPPTTVLRCHHNPDPPPRVQCGTLERPPYTHANTSVSTPVLVPHIYGSVSPSLEVSLIHPCVSVPLDPPTSACQSATSISAVRPVSSPAPPGFCCGECLQRCLAWVGTTEGIHLSLLPA